MKVLLTGATGFLGGRLANRLAAEGHTVRALVRKPAAYTDRPDGAEVVQGDITDPIGFAAAADGCDWIIHGAALVKVWVKDSSVFDEINVGGLQNAADAAKEHGCKLLYVSSFMALGPTDGATHDEQTPRATQETNNDYERTKMLAEQLARKLSADGLPIVRVFPGVVFGPGALTDGNHLVKLLVQHASGKLPGILGSGDLRQCFSYVDDVVEGIVLALNKAEPGSSFVLGGENKTALDLFAAFETHAGVKAPTRKIPFGLAKVIGKLQRWRAELFGIEPELTDEVVGVYRHEWAFSSRHAEQTLGYRITPFEQAIAQTVAWLKERGVLTGSR